MANSKLSKLKLIKLVNKICNAENKDEEELDRWLTLLEQNVPDPEVSDLIFHSDENLTPEEIVEKALSYKPIIMPPPSKNG